MFIRLIAVFSASMLLFSAVKADSDSVTVSLRGKVYNAANPEMRLEDLMMINLRTLLIASTGYESQKVTLRDSVYHQNYYLKIPLVKLNRQLKEVVIFSPRDLQSIYTDIQKLGYNKRDFQLSGVDAVSSPITFLYQQFSALERTKRHNAELRNEDQRRQLLKQLLTNYVAHDIINLNDDEFKDLFDDKDFDDDEDDDY